MEEEKFSRVKVESILSVVSSNPTEPGKIHKFSFLDQSMGLHTIHVVFYYRSNPFKDGPMSSDLDNLRVSLSRVLDEYPIVTGRLTRGPDGDWQVKCNDAGVRMLQASVRTTLDEWLRSADASEERDLTVWEDMPLDPSFWSPFRIQINNFKCGGLGIGLSCSHMHADITSATMLIKSWTQVHRGQPLTHSPIFHLPSTNYSSQTNFSTSSLYYSPNNITPQKMGTATIKFSASAINKCLSQVQTLCPNATPFDVLVALFWSRIAQWQQSDLKRSVSICMDSRNQGHHPPIPYSYFGNALHFSLLTVDADKLLSGELGQVSDYIHRHIAGLNFSSVVTKEGSEGPLRIYGPRLTCINAEHMGDAEMYGAEFNKGERPVHVSYHVGNVEGEGLIIVMPLAEAGLGRTVTLVLPDQQIAKLCKDQVLLDLDPTMLVSGRR
ncbi:hypothetical protein DH2020_023574 [Rehmannia glutinosa]|uniref:Uncharacterized protein n=1 Tax=Rehmannia glutinosa TaxID=99300 RepID=A0ABR0W6F9_REHGL